MHPKSVRVRGLSLLRAGMSLNAASKQLGVSRAALRTWRDEGIEPKTRSATCFVCSRAPCGDEAAYARLLGYYLGDGCISRVGRTFSLRISCDQTYPGIVADVGNTIEAVHVGGRVCHVRAPGVVVVQNCWNHWPCVFPQHGPGRKHDRRLELAPWQRDIVEALPGEVLRGLFHSDGSRTNNWVVRTVAGAEKRYDYPRWQFVNYSEEIRTWCAQALTLLDIPWRQSNSKTISVSTRAGVARLDELVGRKS